MMPGINAANALYRIRRTIQHWLSTSFAKPTALTVAASCLERSPNMSGMTIYKLCLMCKQPMVGILKISGTQPRQICYDCECYYSDNGGSAA